METVSEIELGANLYAREASVGAEKAGNVTSSGDRGPLRKARHRDNENAPHTFTLQKSDAVREEQRILPSLLRIRERVAEDTAFEMDLEEDETEAEDFPSAIAVAENGNAVYRRDLSRLADHLNSDDGDAGERRFEDDLLSMLQYM